MDTKLLIDTEEKDSRRNRAGNQEPYEAFTVEITLVKGTWNKKEGRHADQLSPPLSPLCHANF